MNVGDYCYLHSSLHLLNYNKFSETEPSVKNKNSRQHLDSTPPQKTRRENENDNEQKHEFLAVSTLTSLYLTISSSFVNKSTVPYNYTRKNPKKKITPADGKNGDFCFQGLSKEESEQFVNVSQFMKIEF